MKKIALFLGFICCTLIVSAQKTYTVDGETLELKTEVNGTIELLWNIIDGKYRYFVEKDGIITELKNTKGTDNKFQEEYKSTLNNLTDGSGLSSEKVKLTLFSIRNFIDSYNVSIDPNYSENYKKAKVGTRMLFFGGLSNSPFVENPENKSNPLFGVEVELFEATNLPSHSVFLQVKHALSSDEFEYSTTQIGLGYRFRFINTEAFNLYANVIAASYNFAKNTAQFTIDDQIIIEERSANSFDVPFIFGVGADIKVSENGFITLAYDELFALFIDNQGNFSTHLSIGYKFNL